jgi:hypothetical protein
MYLFYFYFMEKLSDIFGKIRFYILKKYSIIIFGKLLFLP